MYGHRQDPANSAGELSNGELSKDAIAVMVNLHLVSAARRGWLLRMPRMNRERLDAALEELGGHGLVSIADYLDSTPRFVRWLARHPESYDVFRLTDAGDEHPALEHALRRLDNRRSKEGSVV